MGESSFLRTLHARFATPPAHVRAVVRRVTGRAAVSMERIVDGYDNEVYRVGIAGRVEIFVRIQRQGEGDYDEARAMEQAAAAGVPVPRILGIDHVTTDDGVRPVMVVASAQGRALETLGALPPADRHRAMVDLGRVLSRLGTVRMPGMWRPDGNGSWPAPSDLRRGYIRDRRAERPSWNRPG